MKERIYPDHGHMNVVFPKLTTFWRACILPEILGRCTQESAICPMRCHKQVLEYAFAECHQMETL